MTISNALARDVPRLDVEWLLLYVLGQRESSWLYAHGDEELDEGQRHEFERLVAEREAGKPLAYILGEWEFYGRLFYVTEDVLVPRPETERLVELVLPDNVIWRDKYPGEQMRIVDIGTGSGVVAITLLLQGFEGQVLATDISAKALEVAKRNAKRRGVLDKIEFIREDIADTLKRDNIDLIVSNPPYVPSAEATRLPDPRLALDGGSDGTKFVQLIKSCGRPAIVETTGGVIQTFYSDRTRV